MKNTELLSYPYSGKYATRDQWELCYCYSKNIQAGVVVWDKEFYIFKLNPMFGRHVLGLSKLYYKVRFRNLGCLKSFIDSLGVDELKSIIV